MLTQKIIKIFLASSIIELENERKDISSTITEEICNLFQRDDIIIQFKRCDTIHEGTTDEPDQNKLDRLIRECDICLFLLKDKVGQFTRNEFDVARECQKKGKKKPIIFVSFLQVLRKVSTQENLQNAQSLLDFKKYLEKEGIHWNEYDNLSDVKHKWVLGILTYLGITLGDSSPEEKSGDALFVQFEENKEQMHKAIDDLRLQIPGIMKNDKQLITARIIQTVDLYKKADLWASKTDYDKGKYADLLVSYAEFLYKYGFYPDADTIYSRQIPLYEELYGEYNENTARSYNDYGVVLWEEGKDEIALLYYKKALAIRKKIHGLNHPYTAETYNNIGVIYRSQNKYKKSLEYYFKALKINKQTDEKKNNNGQSITATIYNNIGVVYREQGKYHKALQFHKNALKTREKILGRGHEHTAIDYNNIGRSLYMIGDYPEALKYLEKALTIRKDKLGDNHPKTYETQKWIDTTKETMNKRNILR